MTDVLDRAGDIAEFEELKRGLDTRLVHEMKAEDDWQEGTITEVTPYSNGEGWSVSFAGDLTSRGPLERIGTMGCGVPKIEGKPQPRVGGRLRIYGKGFGFQFHGIDLDGEEVFWRTPWERFAKRAEWLAQYDRERRERLAERGSTWAEQVLVLPEPLRKRIERFAAERRGFWLEDGGYELFCCTEAAKFAEFLTTWRTDLPSLDRVKAFQDDREAQKQAGMNDGHSGNTFGGACHLAYRLLEGLDC